MQPQKELIPYIAQSLRDNWERLALTDFDGQSFQYRDVARKIAKLHLLFEHANLKPGDKIAFCGRNCAQWAIGALAALTYGAVAVPILHEFKPDTVHHLVCHSEAKLFFVDAHTWENLDHENMPLLEGAILINDYSLLFARTKRLAHARENLNRLFGEKYPERFTPDDVKYAAEDASTLALINYTSGSTGNSKGVMLTYGNLWSNIQYSIDGLDFLLPGDGMVCMLPLAHMFGLTIELLHPFVKGCHVHFLTRTPSPKVIMGAFAEVRPKLIVTVPLIIEKIVKTKIFPLLDKPLMKLLLHLPFVDKHLLEKIKSKMEETFGGRLKEIIVGGAGLNKEVETFLRRINFPVTVGYGMTECGPLIAYAPWTEQRPASCGRIVDRMQMRVDSPDPANTPGVLWVKGDNVMKGYYKNPEATAAAFDSDGWMNTGDIVNVDADGYIYIRGRDKSMILGPSGQNIYPEEIEHKLNNMPYVAESLVVENEGKLLALIHPDYDAATREGIDATQIDSIMADNIARLNPELPAYSQIAGFKIYQEEFEKTPKRSVKRYLYQR
ncbi:MAG: AMP-binding protein [Muribaculaceae bacterium]|nr:AMP-binding protein [Muribaculaceae bacterium]